MYKYIVEAIIDVTIFEKSRRKFVINSEDQLTAEKINRMIYMGMYDETDVLDDISSYTDLDVNQILSIIEEQNGKTREIN